MFSIYFLTQPWANGNRLISDFKGDIWPWMGTGNSARHEEAIMPAVAIVDLLSNPIWWDRLHRWDERLTPKSCLVWCVCGGMDTVSSAADSSHTRTLTPRPFIILFLLHTVSGRWENSGLSWRAHGSRSYSGERKRDLACKNSNLDNTQRKWKQDCSEWGESDSWAPSRAGWSRC